MHWNYRPAAAGGNPNDIGGQIIVRGIEKRESGRTLSVATVRAKRLQTLYGIDHAVSEKEIGRDRPRCGLIAADSVRSDKSGELGQEGTIVQRG